MGIEPTHNGATIRRVNRFTIPTTCKHTQHFCFVTKRIIPLLDFTVNTFLVFLFLNFYASIPVVSSLGTIAISLLETIGTSSLKSVSVSSKSKP